MEILYCLLKSSSIAIFSSTLKNLVVYSKKGVLNYTKLRHHSHIHINHCVTCGFSGFHIHCQPWMKCSPCLVFRSLFSMVRKHVSNLIFFLHFDVVVGCLCCCISYPVILHSNQMPSTCSPPPHRIVIMINSIKQKCLFITFVKRPNLPVVFSNTSGSFAIVSPQCRPVVSNYQQMNRILQ